MALTSLEAFKLKRYREHYGIENKDECLQLAIEAEDTLKFLPPGDIARPKFYKDCTDLADMAYLLEKESIA